MFAILLAVLGYILSGQIIDAVRAENKDDYERHRVLSQICLGAILLIIGGMIL